MRSPLHRDLAALAVVAVALLVEIAFSGFFSGIPLFLFFVAVFVSALFFGARAGVVASVGSVIATAVYFGRTDPLYGLADPLKVGRLVLFLATGGLISWMVERYRAFQEKIHDELADQIALLGTAAPVLVWVLDTANQCVYVSDRWLEFTGRTLEDELGPGWLETVHPDDRTAVTDTLTQAVQGGTSFEVEYRQRHASGQYRAVVSRGVPRTDRHGRFAGFIGSVVDIDDIRAAERERYQFAADIARERERLVAILANVPGVVWEAWGEPDQRSQRIDFVSDHVARMLGYTVEEWLSTPNFWLQIVHPEDREEAASRAHEHFLAGGTRTNTFRWMTKSGEAIWCESQSTVITDGEGRPLGMRGVTIDISARKKAEESLRFLARVSEVLGSSLQLEATIPEAVRLALPLLGDWCTVSVSEDGVPKRLAVVHTDPARDAVARKLLSTAPGTFPEASPHVDSQRPAAVNDLGGTAPWAGTLDDEHDRVVRALGAGSMLVAPMVARERVVGAVTFLSERPGRYGESDIELASLLARRLALAVDNAHLYRAAVESSSAKDEFLATISHELRTPMTATLGWVRMLRMEGIDEPTQKTALEAIERSTRAQAKLIEDILDVSSVILGKFHIDPEPVDLREVVSAAVATLQPASHAKGISLRVDMTRWHGVVLGDADRLQQVVWNLAANAIKFGRVGGTIDVLLERDGPAARLSVTDDGAGIEPAFLPFVFDRFRQADSTITRRHGGLGLGLAIVRHLVELHGGSVRAESEGVGKGARFVVDLPATIHAASNDPAGAIALPDLSRRKVLVVDDEQPTLDLLGTILRRCGAAVTLASSADAALLALAASPHDLVVTDIAMPDKDGLELLRTMRRGTHATIPVIALTALSEVPSGFDRTLRKPVDPLLLATEVADTIAGRVPRLRTEHGVLGDH